MANNGDDNNNKNKASSNNSKRTGADPAAAEEALRAWARAEDRLDGIDEALSLEVLKPSAPWGLAVYRTAYGDDAAWGRMRDMLTGEVTRSLDWHGRTDDLLPRLSHEFLEDRATLGGAGVRDVRRRFTAWAAEELQRNWRVGDTPPTDEDPRVIGWCEGTRYNFCLLVDEVCLESLDRGREPVVKLVKKDFADEEEGEGSCPEWVASGGWEAVSEGWEGGWTDSDEEDVGWMYLPVSGYVDCCNLLQDPSAWYDGYYVRPPLTSFIRDFASAPGFWRREGHGG